MSESIVLSLLVFTKLATDFSRYAVGTIQTPYETYRTLAQRKDVRLLPFIGLFVFFSLFSAGFVKGGLFVHPLLLTASFVKVVTGILATFLFAVGVIYKIGEILGADVDIQRLFVLWSFSLLPTAAWFMLASASFFLFPPPRTTNIYGQIASVVFIGLSIGLFFWKGILYYLTLRFGLRLDLIRIFVLSLIFLPLVAGYSYLMFYFGIFRVPFL